MADLSQALDTLLSDPETMGQLMDLASQLGLDPPPPGPGPDCQPAQPVEGSLCRDPDSASPPEGLPFGELGDMGKIVKVLSAVNSRGGVDSQTAALLTALRPFLREDRRRKLDRAMKLAGLSKAAQEVLRLWKAGELDV